MGPDDHPLTRASDGEREHAVARLRDAAVEGRLTLEELSERVEQAHRTATRAELDRLVADLPAPARPAAPADVRLRAICSRLDRRGSWRVPRRASVRCFFGTVTLDLREATVGDALVEMDVYNLFGTVTITIPAGVGVEVEGGGVLASQEIQAPAAPPAPDAPRLVIRAGGPGGTLRVRTRPRSGRIEGMLDPVGLGESPGG